MSHKNQMDRQRKDYPFTARQRRQKIGKRLSRKQTRKASRNL